MGGTIAPPKVDLKPLSAETPSSQESRFLDDAPLGSQDSKFLDPGPPSFQKSKFLETLALLESSKLQLTHFAPHCPPIDITLLVINPQPSNETQAPTNPSNPMPSIAHFDNPTINRGADPEDSRLGYVPGTGLGTNLFDADNKFNKVNRYLMLWQMAMLWSKVSCFVYNQYHHLNLIFLHNDLGKLAIILHLKEGLIQGNVFGGQFFMIAMMALCTKMRAVIPNTLQPWYADNSAAGG